MKTEVREAQNRLDIENLQSIKGDLLPSGGSPGDSLEYGSGGTPVWVGPESLTLTYVNGMVTSIDGATVDVDITYNADGTINTVDDQNSVHTMAYANGQLTGVTVS